MDEKRGEPGNPNAPGDEGGEPGATPKQALTVQFAGAQATPADSFARLAPEASRTAKTLATGLHSDFAERLKQIDAGLHGNLMQSLKEIDTGLHAHLAQALKGMDTGLLPTLKKLEAGSAVGPCRAVLGTTRAGAGPPEPDHASGPDPRARPGPDRRTVLELVAPNPGADRGFGAASECLPRCVPASRVALDDSEGHRAALPDARPRCTETRAEDRPWE